MNLLVVTIMAGAFASVASVLALRSSVQFKHAQGQPAWAVAMFWTTVSAYMISFTALRAAAMIDADVLVELYIIQTMAGASTLIALMVIFFGILLGQPASKWAGLGATAAAVVTCWLIFLDIDGPFSDMWSVEFLPGLLWARVLVATFYVLTPTATAILVTQATKHLDDAIRLRTAMFAASVVMMYVPNAIKYVQFSDGIVSAALAIVMAAGAGVGWRSYQLSND